ncbi:hypothetical protein [Pedobacter punctiformis]|uniref:Uncharacterized protein n=1 Tax=Pedobacter punctiformis TaxID=3004097 RepID=A0ABT4LD82_9SPHI|nr:hypothetical protein [Pedobacter sp. HCMS5-2]MCZ4245687.1 hypothetical protein [Pedobacter sp. HCMS5-2]
MIRKAVTIFHFKVSPRHMLIRLQALHAGRYPSMSGLEINFTAGNQPTKPGQQRYHDFSSGLSKERDFRIR